MEKIGTLALLLDASYSCASECYKNQVSLGDAGIRDPIDGILVMVIVHTVISFKS